MKSCIVPENVIFSKKQKTQVLLEWIYKVKFQCIAFTKKNPKTQTGWLRQKHLLSENSLSIKSKLLGESPLNTRFFSFQYMERKKTSRKGMNYPFFILICSVALQEVSVLEV